jgi:formate--tetrahydrofolate ligase
MSLWNKVTTIATEIYDAGEVVADKSVKDQFQVFQEAGYGHFPICMAKTQYSFSTDAAAKGAPSGHTIAIREIRLSAGAEFIVVVTGDIMTMPGLPKVPAANSIKLVNGEVVGLF